jgi:hypothetical protein
MAPSLLLEAITQERATVTRRRNGHAVSRAVYVKAVELHMGSLGYRARDGDIVPRSDDQILLVSCCPCADRWGFVIRSGKNLEHLSRTHGAQTRGNTRVGFARFYFAVSARSRCASRPTRNCERQNADIGFIAVCQTVGNSGITS